MITKTYRGKKTVITNLELEPKISTKGRVVLSANTWSGNEADYAATINADQLLKTAQRCLDQLGSIAGIDYKITWSLKK